jgi:enamine deaminase RidA (YjgF/YER057c/UK114 family)
VRQNVSSGSPWEKSVGYSRAVRVGHCIAVAGTVAAGEKGEAIGSGAYEQSKHIFEKIRRALEECGAGLSDVVRTRAFVTAPEHAAGFQRAHREVFSSIRPAATLVVVSALIDGRFVVEIEADAVLPQKRARASSRSVLRPEIGGVPRAAARAAGPRRRKPREDKEE